MSHPETASRSSERVARNSAIYFLSLGIPAVAAVFLVPITVHAMGPTRFGLLALAWAVAEGSGMFDLGLGRATIRFVAESVAKKDQRIRDIVLSGVYSQGILGTIAGILLFTLAPVLVRRVFSIDPGSTGEAIAMFRVLAIHLPVLLATSSLRAALEGAQRFDLAAALRIPSSVASVAVPAFAATLGYSLPAILWTLLVIRLALLAVGMVTVAKVLLEGEWRIARRFTMLRDMLRYSGWVAISTVLGPSLASFDRFVLGSIVGVTGLGFYTGAAEAANRFLLIPVTAFSALLPALSASSSEGESGRLQAVTRAATRQLAAILLPLCLGLIVFGPVFLGIWLGPRFGTVAGQALQILSLGVFLTGLAHLPLALLYGSGRPDLPARINVLQVAVHVPLTIFLVRRWGINGAASAWSIRCAGDLIFYNVASRRALGHAAHNIAESARWRGLLYGGLLLAVCFALAGYVLPDSSGLSVSIVLSGIAGYMAWGWARVLAPAERRAWMASIVPRRTIDSQKANVP